MLSRLLSAGVVGYKVYEVNGKIEKHFEVVSLGNPRLRNASSTFSIAMESVLYVFFLNSVSLQS